MGENTNIEWAHHSWSPWIGCTKVSKGCTNCYADELMTRKPRWANTWGPRGKRELTSEAYWKRPLKWNREAAEKGVRYRVFPSLCDPFDEHESIDWDWRNAFYELIYETPHLDWLLLTKRPGIAHGYVPDVWHSAWPENIWVGTSVENQETADERIRELREIPARIRFLSCEPLLGPVDLSNWFKWGADNPIHWVIIGGESGSKARPMNISWAEDIIDQCQAVGVPVFMKQLGTGEKAYGPGYLHFRDGDPVAIVQDRKGGDINEWPPRFRIRQFPKGVHP